MSNPTFSLAEVANDLRLDKHMKDPARWLRKQIKNGRIQALPVGRTWVMTQSQIDAAIEDLSSGQRRRPVAEPTPIGLSAASMRRRAS